MQADRTIEKRMRELAQRAARTGLTQFTGFLSPAGQAQAEICGRQAGVFLHTWGGIPEAERRVAAYTETDAPPEDWPVAGLMISWNHRYGSPAHRDILGAALGLGFDREKLGDILIAESRGYMFVLEELSGYIAANLESVGRVPVRVEPMTEPPQTLPTQGTPMRVTVASMRLDAVLGAAWKLSRGKAAELVTSGRVQVSHRLELRPDCAVAPGAVLSVRGMGRVAIEEIGGRTSKGRTSVTLLRYG